MILHLVDDHFATNSCLKIFEDELPGENIILVFSKYFGYSINNGISLIENNISDILRGIDFSQIKYVIVSYLSREKILFIKKYIPKSIPLIWWTYGSDLYVNFLKIRGLKVFYSSPDSYGRFGKLALPFLTISRFFANIYFRHLQNKYVIKRLVGFVPCIQPEYDLLCQYVKKDFSLIRIHPFGASFKFDGRFTQGKDIALGHSASISDNHLYALKLLKNLDLGDSDLYLTLSYSNQIPRYTEEVKQKYKDKYGDKVHFIESMMPRDEYFRSQFRYKAMILSSWRQEALDNIYTCLQIGIRLILSEKGILYKFFQEYGFKVYSLEMLTQEVIDTPLPLQERIHNQQLFEQFVSERKKNFYDDFRHYFLK